MKPTINILAPVVAIMCAAAAMAKSQPHPFDQEELGAVDKDHPSYEALLYGVNYPFDEWKGQAMAHTGSASHVLHKRSPVNYPKGEAHPTMKVDAPPASRKPAVNYPSNLRRPVIDTKAPPAKEGAGMVGPDAKRTDNLKTKKDIDEQRLYKRAPIKQTPPGSDGNGDNEYR